MNSYPLVEEQELSAQKDANSLYLGCKSCPKSHHCCYRATTIVVLPKEAEKIIEKVKSHDVLREEKDGLFTIVKQESKPCPFLTDQGLCGIYDIRPTDCRSWPLTLTRDTSEKIEYLVDMGCPEAQSGKLSEGFVNAARQVLHKIEMDVRSTFTELVHRDSLPLMPFTVANKNGETDGAES